MRILDVHIVKVVPAVLLLDDSLAVLHGGLGGALLVAEGHGESEQGLEPGEIEAK